MEELESDVSTVTVEEDPFANCEKNLLEHVMNMQDKIEGRLDLVDEQVAGWSFVQFVGFVLVKGEACFLGQGSIGKI